MNKSQIDALMNNKEEFEKLAKQGYEEVDKNKNGSLDFNEIKSIMRFINNAAEEVITNILEKEEVLVGLW